MERAEFLKEALEDIGINVNAELVERRLKDLFLIPNIKVKYHNRESFGKVTPIAKSDIGNFIDLRAAEDIELKAGDFKMIPLGVSIELPEGYWAQIVPRSSLFKKHGIIMANSFGVVDTSYCGDNDEWKMPVYATRDTKIDFDERICQFRIVRDIPFGYVTVDHLENPDRNGFGSTGDK